jgi:hypothetical protein
VYKTGCSAGEQYSHGLFSRVLLEAKVGGGGYRQATIWAGGGNTDPENQGLVMDGAAD